MDNLPTIPVRCRTCRLTFDTNDELQQHYVQSEKHLTCQHCYAQFMTSGGLAEHLRQLHPAEQDIACKCGQRFTRAAALIAHMTDGFCSSVKADFDLRRAQMMMKHAALAPREDLVDEVANGHRENLKDEHVAMHRGNSNSKDVATHHHRETSEHKIGLPVVPVPVKDSPDHYDDDLLIFDDPPRQNGLSTDNPWSTEQNYEIPYAKASPKGKGKAKEDVLTSSQGGKQGGVAKKSWAQIATQSVPILQPEIEPAEEMGEWVQAAPSNKPTELTQDELMQQIETQRMAKEEQNKKNPFHPTHPDFNANKYWNSVLHVYKCPYQKCGNAFIQHLLSAAHQDDKITCVVCLRIYNSPTAYVQHFESQGKKCKARNTGNQILNMVTGGVIKIIGENADSTNKYAAWVDEKNIPDTPEGRIIFNNLKAQQDVIKRREEATKKWNENPQW